MKFSRFIVKNKKEMGERKSLKKRKKTEQQHVTILTCFEPTTQKITTRPTVMRCVI